MQTLILFKVMIQTYGDLKDSQISPIVSGAKFQNYFMFVIYPSINCIMLGSYVNIAYYITCLYCYSHVSVISCYLRNESIDLNRRENKEH